MKVLHICNGLVGSKVHHNLFWSLDQKGVEQTVYCPVRNEDAVGRNQFISDRTSFEYSVVIKSWYKYVYPYKSYMLYRDLKKRIHIGQYDVIHASTLFSDGVLAYKAYKDFGIPYIIAIRNTDINDFIRLLKYTYPIGRKIVKHASSIIFISKGLMKSFVESNFLRPIKDDVDKRLVFQPNGIDDFWLNNICRESRKGKTLLYIGDFSDNKNVGRLIEAVARLRRFPNYEDVKLMIVGGGNEIGDHVTTAIDKHHDFVKHLGKIYDKSELAKVMRQCAVFAMPSIYETFGLVYLEALSQNLPVIYTRGQGIDGLFDNTVGIGTDPKSVEEICFSIKSILENQTEYGNAHVDFTMFDWSGIADRYIECYNRIMKLS